MIENEPDPKMKESLRRARERQDDRVKDAEELYGVPPQGAEAERGKEEREGGTSKFSNTSPSIKRIGQATGAVLLGVPTIKAASEMIWPVLSRMRFAILGTSLF